jgi:hypothetical protein
MTIMSFPENQTATWNRDDRDLLVELRTNMQNARDDIAAARIEIKEINTGVTARLLNLEGNAVNKIEIAGFEDRIRELEATANQWLGKQSLIAATIGIVAGLIGSYIQAVKM